MKHTLTKFFIIALFCLSIFLVWKTYRSPNKGKNAELIKAQLEEDKRILKKGHATEQELKAALMRLSEQKDPSAERLSFERAESSDAEVRKNAAQALGFIQNEEAEQKLLKLSHDSVLSVRLSAIQAAGYRQTPGRINILKMVVTKESSGIEEKLQAISTLAHSPLLKFGERQSYIEYVVKLSNDPAQKKWLGEIIKTLIALAPKDPQTLQLINDTLSSVNTSDPASPEAMMISIQSLHRSCPDNRVALLEKVLSSTKDLNVLRSVFFELSLLNTSETIALANKSIEKSWLTPPIKLQMKNQLKRFEGQKSFFCQVLKRGGL